MDDDPDEVLLDRPTIAGYCPSVSRRRPRRPRLPHLLPRRRRAGPSATTCARPTLEERDEEEPTRMRR